MKREEQIHKEATARIPIEMIPFRKYFIQGALWSDGCPRKGLVDIEKVCSFLSGFSFIPSYVIKQLRLAVEE